MIHEFLDSWGLFGNTYVVGWLVCAALAIIGVLVVARNQVFAGAALSQASTLGIAAAMWAGMIFGGAAEKWSESDAFLTGVSIAVSLLAAVLTGGSFGQRRESREAIMAWLFLLGASGAIVMVSHSPHGMEEVQRLLSSSIIGASGKDVLVFSALLGATVLGTILWWRPLLFWVMDPATAQAAGVRVRTVETLTSLWLGLGVGLAIRSSGMIYTFGCLVLPALIAKSLCREVRKMFIVAPVAGVVLSLLAFVLANHFDYPPAQMAVALQCVALVVAWTWRVIVP